jgi:hypothetical protein
MDVADGAHVVSHLAVVAEAEAMANRPVVVVVVAVVAVVDAVAAMVRLLKPSQRPAVALLTNPLNSACHGLLPRYVFFLSSDLRAICFFIIPLYDHWSDFMDHERNEFSSRRVAF